MSEQQITKRRVTMTSYVVTGVEDGKPVTQQHQAIDYVRPDFLDAYVEHARQSWQHVEVSEEPDAGPGGYDGATVVPAYLDHPLAGQVFPATGDKGGE